MTKLETAIMLANARKMAGVGDSQQGVVVADNELQDRAIFSGFDIEYGELLGTSTEVASKYWQSTHNMGLLPLFISAWCDGLLTGLMLASIPEEPDASG